MNKCLRERKCKKNLISLPLSLLSFPPSILPSSHPLLCPYLLQLVEGTSTESVCADHACLPTLYG